ncbi:MAG: MFS transporter [Candidatus Sumerlaeia bacterium]|nr:MFS transporter [Candidatus Sumerlaeia bacterium]
MQYLVYLTAFFVSVAQAMAALATPLLAIHQFGAQNRHLGLIAAATCSVYTVVSLSSGRISEHLPVRAHLAGCLTLLAACYAAMFYSGFFAILVLLNAVVGISTGLLWAPLESVLSRLSPPEQMRRNVGRYNLSWSLGMTLGFFIFSWLENPAIHHGDFRSFLRVTFWATAALVLLTAGVTLFLRAPRARSHFGNPDDRPFNPRGDGRRRFFLLTAWSGLFAAYVCVGAARQLFPKLATETALSPTVMGYIYGLGVGAQTIVMSLLGRWGAWHYRHEAFYVGEMGVIAGVLLIAAGRTPVAFAAGHIVLGATMAVLYSCSLYYSMEDSVSSHHNTSVHEGIIGTASSMPLILGWLADRFRFTPLSFYIAAGVTACVLVAHGLLFRKKRREGFGSTES